jgi:thioredoxin-related protein
MMVKAVLYSLVVMALNSPGWHYNLDEAKAIAHKEHKYILLIFSGSDWCGPCILLRKEILDDSIFLKMADSSLVLVNADFPRKKKNQLSPQQQSVNDALADRYDSEGQFPRTILLNADGKLLKTWDGYPNVKPDVFTAEIESVIDANK